MPPLLCKILALLLSCASWALSVGIANSTSWRVWEFDSEAIGVMHIGLWETYYVEHLNTSGHMSAVTMKSALNESWTIPDEIYYGQDLILLANFLTPVSLVFSSLAVWATWHQAPYPDFLRTCYSISAGHLFFSCFFITLTLSWNFIIDLYGHTTLDFPPGFPVIKEQVLSKRTSYVLPLGVTSACFKLISFVIFAVDAFWVEENDQGKRRKSTRKIE